MKTNIKDYIFRVDNFLDKEFCQKLIKKLNKLNWGKHSYYNATVDIANSYDNDLSIMSPDIPESVFLQEKISVALKNYFEFINLYHFQGITKYSKPRFNRYDITTEMRIHCDHIQSLFDGVDKGVPILTILGTLNEGYKGGDFLMFDKEVVPMYTGTLLIFPSNFLYPHAVTPVTKGTRYSYVSWGW